MSSGLGAPFLIFSILVAGYIPATRCYAFRYKTARESGHRLYLTTAVLGFFAFFLSGVLIYLIDFLWFFLSHLPWLETSNGFFKSGKVLVLSLMAPVLSSIMTFLYNKSPNSKNKNIHRVWEEDDLSALLSYATRNIKPIAITTSSRKVYIGYVARTNEPDRERSHITLLPLYSGYRDKDSLRLHVTIEYEEVFSYYENEVGEADVEDFYVVIPVSEIVSSHVFNPAIYHKVNMDRSQKTESGN